MADRRNDSSDVGNGFIGGLKGPDGDSHTILSKEERRRSYRIFNPDTSNSGRIFSPDSGFRRSPDAFDEIVVAWDGPNDAQNPQNWSKGRKWMTTLIISMFSLISTISITMVTPATHHMAAQFDIASAEWKQLMMCIFLLGYAIGPFALGPLSELYGRYFVLQLATLWFLAFNTGCGFATTKAQFLVCRFLAGMGACVPQAICNGILADIWSKKDRGSGWALYSAPSYIGPCLGPILGAYIVKYSRWPWIFWSVSIFTVLVQLVACLLLQETYEPLLLKRKAKLYRRNLEANGMHEAANVVKTDYDETDRRSRVIRRRLVLPVIMMYSHPAVLVPSSIRACFYGIQFLLLSTIYDVFGQFYGHRLHMACLHYLAMLIGFLIGLAIQSYISDKFWRRCQWYYSSSSGQAEWRVPPLLLGGLLCPTGLLIYGWTAQHRNHYLIPDLGLVIFATGLAIVFQSVQLYITDAYDAEYVASAMATGAFLRVLCAFTFPLFAPKMYNALDVGWGNTLLAFVALVLSVSTPMVLWVYGKKLRQMSVRGIDKGSVI